MLIALKQHMEMNAEINDLNAEKILPQKRTSVQQ